MTRIEPLEPESFKAQRVSSPSFLPTPERANANKVVICLSGGMDSTALFAKFLMEGNTVFPLIFDYGQRHQKKENAAAHEIFTHYQKIFPKLLPREPKLIKIDLRQIGASALTDSNIEVPNNMKEQPRTVVPYRNTLLVTLAMAYAESLGLDTVAITPVKEDYESYPDCRPEYFSALQVALSKGAKANINGPAHVFISTPFINWWKKDIVTFGLNNKVPFDLSWSCYNGRELPCCLEIESDLQKLHKKSVGCPACVERVNAFAANGTLDPLLVKLSKEKVAS